MFIEYNHFKMHALQEDLKLATLIRQMASLDITNSFYSYLDNESFQ